MRQRNDCFHLAIPVRDLDEAFDFYITALGCKLARRYEDRITVDFFGDQLVCHLHDETLERPTSLYPRHFGITFRRERDFAALHELCVLRKLPFFADVSTRFEGRSEVHQTFVLEDPSGNLLEFKHYRDPRMMY
jgi:uncharacterized protein